MLPNEAARPQHACPGQENHITQKAKADANIRLYARNCKTSMPTSSNPLASSVVRNAGAGGEAVTKYD